MALNLSVVIPAYEHLEKVLVCLNSLQAFATHKNQYIVSDDASPNTLYPALLPPCLAEVHRRAINGGFCVNVNAGAQQAKGDILLLLNQDVFAVGGFSDGWDAALLAAFDNPAVGIVGVRLLFPDGKIQSAGGMYDGKCQPYHRNLGWSVLTHPDINTPRSVSWTTGGALAIRRIIWEQLGGVDEGYTRGYGEDVDLCERVKQVGYKVWYEPRATFVHSVGSTGGNPYFTQNLLRFKKKWVDSGIVKPDTQAIYERFW